MKKRQKSVKVTFLPPKKILPLHPRVLGVERGTLVLGEREAKTLAIVLRPHGGDPLHVVFEDVEDVDTFVRMVQDTREEVWPGVEERVDEERIGRYVP